MQVSEMIDSARDALNVRRVFGEPIEKDGITIIPAAKIGGGAGGGSGDGEEGSGSGGGFGLSAKPAGAYIVRDGDVRWEPAIDVNRIVLGGQIVGVVLLLVIAVIVRSRSNASQSD
jgi:uncharacterized spore protein YtfJ